MRKIKTAPDAKGELLDVYWQDTLVNCPAMSTFLKVYAETLDRGYANPYVTWSNKNRVVWAQSRAQVIVGGICYEYVPEPKMGWIVLSFTDPAWRGRRINEMLHTVMEEDVKKLGGERISSLVHVDNISRQKSAERVGLKPQFYRMNKVL